MKPNRKLLKKLFLLFLVVSWTSCKQEPKLGDSAESKVPNSQALQHAKGLAIEKTEQGVTILTVSSPWPQAQAPFTYALVPKDSDLHLDAKKYDAIIEVPVSKIVATSTTHIPALEALGQLDKLIGFPDTQYISSPQARMRIDAGLIAELGQNESLNTEMVIAARPNLVIGFSISHENKAYETIARSGIPVVYNGEWTEETPLGKAEWIKFFAPFFQEEARADSIFTAIETDYQATKLLASGARNKPTVLSGALYKDVWYLPGGKSWGAQFLEDAHTDYLWQDTPETGSLALSLESVLEKGSKATFWVSPSQFTRYAEMLEANLHYKQFAAFQNQQVYTYANARGRTGGMIYFELAPNRPDLVLRDLIHIFHPELLPDHVPTFFNPLE